MANKQSEREFEEKRLAHTIAIAKEQLERANRAAEGKKEEIMEAKRDVRENSQHSIGNLWGSDGFEALVEMSQCMNPVTEKIADYEDEKRKIFQLENLMKSPYFARIDFRFEDEEEAENIYIGRSSLKDTASREMYVYDWRSPIASVFYRFMPGEAFYDAPGGRIYGEVDLKRQYEIRNGQLEYFFDANVQINDEFLRNLLSQNTSPQMKAIVETIQREQDMVIRDMENDLLMVQGVAGSGKTSIALHRAAYLMYQGLQSKLAANSILILSPNTIFEQYISNVLPELGEENVVSVVFEEILRKILKTGRIQSKHSFLEHLVSNSSQKAMIKNSMEFKTSEAFQKVLERFLKDIPERFIHFEDIYHNGNCAVEGKVLKNRILKRNEKLLGIRLDQLEEYVMEHIFGTERKRKDREDRELIRQQLYAFTKLDVIGLYQQLFQDEAYFAELTKDVCDSKMQREIWTYTRENLESERLSYEDAIAIAYLSLRIYGSNRYRNIRQVVIDEAQDYYPLQYEICRMLFPNSKFTVLGDINQTLAKQENLSFYKQVQRILDKKSSTLIRLEKSFRCTNEILNFSLQFVERRPEIESFNRKGDSPRVVIKDNREELLEKMVQEVEICQEKGYKTIALICKTERNAERLFDALKEKIPVQLIKNRSVTDLQGIFLIPLYMSKGLEFDAVLICDADKKNYYDTDDKNLLYVGCTRALHRLSLFGEGKASPWIRPEI